MSSVEPNWPNDRDHLRMDGRVAPDLSSPTGVPNPSRGREISGLLTGFDVSIHVGSVLLQFRVLAADAEGIRLGSHARITIEEASGV